MSFPSSLPFTSFLRYSARGTSLVSRQAKAIVIAIKNDSVAATRNGSQRIIPYTAKRLAELRQDFECLRDCFSDGVLAVPAPRSTPLVEGGLWPALQLCIALRAEGLVSDYATILQRKTPVTKSATAGAGKRPSVDVHFASLAVEGEIPLLAPNGRIVIVDDVVTRGATLLAAYSRLRESFPENPIECFASVRTISDGEVETVVDPVRGTITFGNSYLHREP